MHLAAGQNAFDSRDYPTAAEQFLAALSLAERFGQADPRLAATLTNLGLVYKLQGKYREAEGLYKRAIKIDERTNDSDLGRDLNNLAMLYRVEGRFAESESLLERVVGIVGKMFESNKPKDPLTQGGMDQLYEAFHFITFLENLAEIYRDHERYADAERTAGKVLAIRERYTSGGDEEGLAMDLDLMGQIYSLQRKYAAAEPFYVRALAIGERISDPTILDLPQLLEHYATLLRETEREAESEKLSARAQNLRKVAAETVAVNFLRNLHTALLMFRYAYDDGYPPSLVALGWDSNNRSAACAHAQLLENALAEDRATHDGYRFTYVASGKSIAEPPAGCPAGRESYTVTAVPLAVGQTGQRAYFVDETGVIRFTSDGSTPTVNSPPIQ